MSAAEIGNGAAIFGCAQTALQADERDFFREYDPFGFILFARNVDTPEQLRRLTGDLREAVGRDAPILVDQEGGRVQRLRPPHWRGFMPPLELIQSCQSPEAAAEAMALVAQLIAGELRAVGIDANCAPVADVARPETHAFLRNRCYGDHAAAVALISRAVADAYLAAGVLPVVKHMPGHGRAQLDSHLHLPQVDIDRAQLQAVDFAPFRALADLPMAMTAHIVYAAYDDDHPATQSIEMLRVIREEIGFKGLLMTDDLNMQALAGDLSARTAASMAAGCDIALHCNGDFAQMQQVAQAAGGMTPASRIRAAAALAARIAPPQSDTRALEARLKALAPGAMIAPA